MVFRPSLDRAKQESKVMRLNKIRKGVIIEAESDVGIQEELLK